MFRKFLLRQPCAWKGDDTPDTVTVVDRAGKNDIRLTALNDPDLEPLWNQISEI
jgi:hypothetical protein